MRVWPSIRIPSESNADLVDYPDIHDDEYFDWSGRHPDHGEFTEREE